MRAQVIPQRRVSGAWTVVEKHRATHWTVVVQGRVYGRYEQKSEAEKHLLFAAKRVKGPPKGYSLGRQMGLPRWR